ncbi:hypothetical protein PCE1_002877 [Barthelona sp. PCE]
MLQAEAPDFSLPLVGVFNVIPPVEPLFVLPENDARIQIRKLNEGAGIETVPPESNFGVLHKDWLQTHSTLFPTVVVFFFEWDPIQQPSLQDSIEHFRKTAPSAIQIGLTVIGCPEDELGYIRRSLEIDNSNIYSIGSFDAIPHQVANWQRFFHTLCCNTQRKWIKQLNKDINVLQLDNEYNVYSKEILRTMLKKIFFLKQVENSQLLNQNEKTNFKETKKCILTCIEFIFECVASIEICHLYKVLLHWLILIEQKRGIYFDYDLIVENYIKFKSYLTNNEAFIAKQYENWLYKSDPKAICEKRTKYYLKLILLKMNLTIGIEFSKLSNLDSNNSYLHPWFYFINCYKYLKDLIDLDFMFQSHDLSQYNKNGNGMYRLNEQEQLFYGVVAPGPLIHEELSDLISVPKEDFNDALIQTLNMAINSFDIDLFKYNRGSKRFFFKKCHIQYYLVLELINNGDIKQAYDLLFELIGVYEDTHHKYIYLLLLYHFQECQELLDLEEERVITLLQLLHNDFLLENNERSYEEVEQFQKVSFLLNSVPSAYNVNLTDISPFVDIVIAFSDTKTKLFELHSSVGINISIKSRCIGPIDFSGVELVYSDSSLNKSFTMSALDDDEDESSSEDECYCDLSLLPGKSLKLTQQFDTSEAKKIQLVNVIVRVGKISVSLKDLVPPNVCIEILRFPNATMDFHGPEKAYFNLATPFTLDINSNDDLMHGIEFEFKSKMSDRTLIVAFADNHANRFMRVYPTMFDAVMLQTVNPITCEDIEKNEDRRVVFEVISPWCVMAELSVTMSYKPSLDSDLRLYVTRSLKTRFLPPFQPNILVFSDFLSLDRSYVYNDDCSILCQLDELSESIIIHKVSVPSEEKKFSQTISNDEAISIELKSKFSEFQSGISVEWSLSSNPQTRGISKLHIPTFKYQKSNLRVVYDVPEVVTQGIPFTANIHIENISDTDFIQGVISLDTPDTNDIQLKQSDVDFLFGGFTHTKVLLAPKDVISLEYSVIPLHIGYRNFPRFSVEIDKLFVFNIPNPPTVFAKPYE